MKILGVAMNSTRFAPTLSGHLHIGLLYNAVLNYLYARQNDLAFNIRFDAQKVNNERLSWGKSILQDLEVFGVKPNKIIWQHKKRQKYIDIAKGLAKDPRTYFCDCREYEIWVRWLAQPEKLRGIIRLEKYPGYCNLKHLTVTGGDTGDDITGHFFWSGPNFDNEHPLANAFKIEDSHWTPFCHGYYGDRRVVLIGKSPKEIQVNGVILDWLDFPAGSIKVKCGNRAVAKCGHNFPIVSSFTQDTAFPAGRVQQLTFPNILTREIRIELARPPLRILREYQYDGFCRDRKLQSDFSHPRTILRIRETLHVDVAIFFNTMPDLCLTSAIDDRDEEVVASIRGEDIRPFTWLEEGAASLLDYTPNNIFHPVLVDDNHIKYSKFVKSPQVTDLMTKHNLSPERVLGFIASLIEPTRGTQPITLKKLLELPFPKFDTTQFPILIVNPKWYLQL